MPEQVAIPDLTDFTPAQLEAGRLLFARECKFINGSTTLLTLPEATLPEIAFAGRSNVGKSSLLNALTGRNTLARTSNTPGRTRQLNFFDLGERMMLVDLPGYGYAAAPKGDILSWNRLIKTYLSGRVALRRVCVLIDARHGVKDTDEPTLKMLDKTAVAFQLVLTKMDKLKAPEQAAALAAAIKIARDHPAAYPTVHATSSETGLGIAELRAALCALAAEAPVA